jgi:peptide/nickel transport system permease protein
MTSAATCTANCCSGRGPRWLSTTIATLVGGWAAVRGGWVDGLLMRFADVVLTLPFLPVVVLAAAFLGRTTAERIVVISLLIWAGPARVIRSGAMAALSRPHVEVARSMGAGTGWLLVRHASFVAGPLLVPVAVRSAAGAVGLDAALSFLGLGDPTAASWGTMLYWAQVRGAFLSESWTWWALPPGIALAILVLGLALIGVSSERRLNPTLAHV